MITLYHAIWHPIITSNLHPFQFQFGPSLHKAMLHEAIFLATCLSTMTTEKHCKLQRGCHTFAIFFRNLQPPAGHCLQLFLCQLEISCEQKTCFDCLIFTKLRCRLRWTCHTQQIDSHRCEKLRIFLFLQLAMQHFVAVAGGVTREIFLATSLATFVARQVGRKIASCNMAYSLRSRRLSNNYRVCGVGAYRRREA